MNKITGRHSAPRRRARNHLRYYADSSHPAFIADRAARDHARRLRHWGFALGLVLLAVALLCGWGLSVLTDSGAGHAAPPTTSARVTSPPASP